MERIAVALCSKEITNQTAANDQPRRNDLKAYVLKYDSTALGFPKIDSIEMVK